MQITLNGEARDYDAATLFELWRVETEHLELQEPRGFAIARNGKVVRRAEWSDIYIEPGDRIEIVRAMQGG